MKNQFNNTPIYFIEKFAVWADKHVRVRELSFVRRAGFEAIFIIAT